MLRFLTGKLHNHIPANIFIGNPIRFRGRLIHVNVMPPFNIRPPRKRGTSSDRSCFGPLELFVGFVRPAVHSLSRVLQICLDGRGISFQERDVLTRHQHDCCLESTVSTHCAQNRETFPSDAEEFCALAGSGESLPASAWSSLHRCSTELLGPASSRNLDMVVKQCLASRLEWLPNDHHGNKLANVHRVDSFAIPVLSAIMVAWGFPISCSP